jgi:xylose isomerase
MKRLRWLNQKSVCARLLDYAKQKQKDSGVKLLWGTANLFGNPRYMNGAATNPDFHVVCHAAAQVKNAIDATIELGWYGLYLLGWQRRVYVFT